MNNTYALEDFAGNGTIANDVENYLEAQNPGTTARVRTGGSVTNYTSQNLNNSNTPAPVTPLLAAAGGVEAADSATAVVHQGGLTQADLDRLVPAARARWVAAGLDKAQAERLRGLTFAVQDMRDLQVGSTKPGHVTIDSDAGGYGWFIDATPQDDVEFSRATSGTRLYTAPSGVPAGRLDLLTAVMHEMGHELGLDDCDSLADRDSLMFGRLTAGERRLPALHEALFTGDTLMAEPFLSEIRIMSFVFAPKGWALCNGQLLPINQNQALFSLLGTSFGGDGRVNFALPDLRARTPIHVGSGHTLGERGGEAAHTLSIGELPTHTHVLNGSSADADNALPGGNLFAKTPQQVYGPAGNLVALNAGMVTNTGGSQPHLNMQPFLTLTFAIALQGIFPSPN